MCFSFFFFNDTATTEIYTLSLHDALPIYALQAHAGVDGGLGQADAVAGLDLLILHEDEVPELEEPVAILVRAAGDRKSTRLNSSHANISYAVFCLKKKKINKHQ